MLTTMETTKNTVLEFLKALNEENFDKARTLVTDDLKFTGVMGTRDGADTYFNDMRKMKLKYEILKVFADEKDVCVFYDINLDGQMIFSCGWYHLSGSKIKNFRVVFDPRPLLEEKDKP